MQEKRKETTSSLWNNIIEFIDTLLMVVGGITFFVILHILLFFIIMVIIRVMDISYIISSVIYIRYIISFISSACADILSQYTILVVTLSICTVYFVTKIIRLEIAYWGRIFYL